MKAITVKPPYRLLECPECGKVTLHDDRDIGIPNWGNPVCECEHCGYIMLESEFNDAKVEI